MGNNIRCYFKSYVSDLPGLGTFQSVVFGVLFVGFFWVWLTDTIDISKRKFKGAGVMLEITYYEARIHEINEKIIEQEICLEHAEDIMTRMEIRYRIANLAMERQTYVQAIKNLLL